MEYVTIVVFGGLGVVIIANAWWRKRKGDEALARSASDIPDRIGRCPVCDGEALVAQAAAGESRCVTCDGCLLSPDRARDLVFVPRGLTPGALKAVGTGRGVAASCPACGGDMRPVLVDDDVVDVCLHCGALWCDADELGRLLRADGFAR